MILWPFQGIVKVREYQPSPTKTGQHNPLMAATDGAEGRKTQDAGCRGHGDRQREPVEDPVALEPLELLAAHARDHPVRVGDGPQRDSNPFSGLERATRYSKPVRA